MSVVDCGGRELTWMNMDRYGLGCPTLWIDESPMNLCEILGLQPKGVATLSFSSRKRPAYAGMTVREL